MFKSSAIVTLLIAILVAICCAEIGFDPSLRGTEGGEGRELGRHKREKCKRKCRAARDECIDEDGSNDFAMVWRKVSVGRDCYEVIYNDNPNCWGPHAECVHSYVTPPGPCCEEAKEDCYDECADEY